MVFILSDEVLEGLKCSACKKYLSVKPIKVYSNSEIKCGRCSQPGDDGVVSLYGIIAEESLFKCVNRYDGCNRLLTYPDVQAHERECLSNTYACPICCPTREFATFLLPDHFQTQHPNTCLGKPEISLELSSMESEEVYFYRQHDCLFIISVRVSQSENVVGFKVVFVAKETVARKVKHKVWISSVDRRIVRITKRQPCSTLGIHNGGTVEVTYSDIASVGRVFCKFEIDTLAVASLTVLPTYQSISKQDNVEVPCNAEQLEERLFPMPVLSENFENKYPDFFISPCGLFLRRNKGAEEIDVLPLFCILCYHKLVRVFSVLYELNDGLGYLCDKCSLVIFERFAEKIILEDDVFEEINLSCRWGCGSVSRVDHNCKNHPSRICPLSNCQRVGTLDELVSHFQESHKLSYKKSARFFSHELLESQTIILLILNRFVVLDVGISSATKTFTATVIDKQYTSTRYIPVILVGDFFKTCKRHEYFFSISKNKNVFFQVSLSK